MGKKVAVLIALACCAWPLAGATHLAQAKGSETAAIELSKLMLTDEIYSQTLQQVSSGIAQSLAAAGGPMPPDFAQKLEKVVGEALPRKEMLEFNAQIYGSRFSEAELQETIAFYKTPTGSKLLRELPSITRDVAIKVGQLIPQRLPALMKKHGLMPKGS